MRWFAPLALVLAGCGAQAAAPHSGPRHLFDDLSSARFVGGDPLKAPRSLIPPLGERDWLFASRLDQPAVGGTVAAERGWAAVDAQGGIRLTGARVAGVLTATEAPAGEWVQLRATLSVRDHSLDVEEGYVRLGLVEVGVEAEGLDLPALAESIVATHFTPPRRGHDPEGSPEALLVRVDPRTRSLLVVLEQVDASAAGATAWMGAVDLVALGNSAGAQAVAEDPLELAPGWERPQQARFAADLVHRRGVALPPGGALEVPLEAAAAGRRVECWAAVLGQEFEGQASAHVELVGDRPGGSELASESLALLVDTDPNSAPAGWTRLAGTLPATLPPEARLRFSVDLDGADRRTTVPVVAGGVLAGDPPVDATNLLLIVLDTLRADRVGATRRGVALTPALDALSARSIRFDAAWSTAPYTLPSMASMLTGLEPTVHGVERITDRLDPARTPTLATLLRAQGYRTVAFTAGGFALPRFGFDAGFEAYGTHDPWPNLESERVRGVVAALEGHSMRSAGVSDPGAIDRTIREFGAAPWFALVHTYAAHEFDPPQRLLRGLWPPDQALPDATDPQLRRHLHSASGPPTAAREALELLYDGGVRQADELVARLLADLDARGQRENTVVVVTSDHGKELGERSVVGHGHSLFEELVHVPWITCLPGGDGSTVSRPVSSLDLLPTLLGALGVEPEPTLPGRDLLSPGSLDDRPIWAEVDTEFRLQALRDGDSKVLWDRDGDEWLGFDLGRDPAERSTVEVLASERDRLVGYHARLLARRDQVSARTAARQPGRVSLEGGARNHLRALGYTDGE